MYLKLRLGGLNYDSKFQGGEYKLNDPKDNLKRVITSFSKFRIDKESDYKKKM